MLRYVNGHSLTTISDIVIKRGLLSIYKKHIYNINTDKPDSNVMQYSHVEVRIMKVVHFLCQ